MYAIVRVGDKQFWVREGDRVVVPRRVEAEGAALSIADVLFVGDNGSSRVGKPTVDGAVVGAKVEAHIKGPKVVNFKFRRRKGSKKTIGHRQPLTRIVIEKISV